MLQKYRKWWTNPELYSYSRWDIRRRTTLQISLDLCIPEKELAKTRSQISFIYFQSHSWYSARNYLIPKGIMKTRFEPRLRRMPSWKNILDLNSGPLWSRQFVTGPSKLDNEGNHKSVQTANNFEFMYSWQRISQNLFPKFIHIYSNPKRN